MCVLWRRRVSVDIKGNVYFKKSISHNNNHTQIGATKQRKQPNKAQINVVSNKVLHFY